MSTTFLIADDSLFARMLVKDAIKQACLDPEFIEAKSGQETLARANANSAAIDWFLLDMNMEAPNGIETAQQLISDGIKCTRIAIVTGNRSSELRDQAKQLGIQCINKAVSPDDVNVFVERIHSFIGGKH